MKKVIFSAFLMMMGLFFISCSGTKDFKTVLENAQKDGANWSVEEWKDAYRVSMQATKPMLEELSKIKENAQNLSEEDKVKMLGELAEKMKKYEELSNQLEAFNKAAHATENGKKVSEDLEFQKELAKELGMDKLVEDM